MKKITRGKFLGLLSLGSLTPSLLASQKEERIIDASFTPSSKTFVETTREKDYTRSEDPALYIHTFVQYSMFHDRYIRNTQVKDRNGREIWEGDKIKIQHRYVNPYPASPDGDFYLKADVVYNNDNVGSFGFIYSTMEYVLGHHSKMEVIEHMGEKVVNGKRKIHSTGWKDKHGKEVLEGDFLNSNYDWKGKLKSQGKFRVVYDEQMNIFDAKDFNGSLFGIDEKFVNNSSVVKNNGEKLK